MRLCAFVVAAAVLAGGGGDDEAKPKHYTPKPPATGGVPAEGALDDGSCQPAGVPPDACGDGFEAADGGCSAILPPDPCGPGLVALPGDMQCHEIAPCGDGTWGDIPIDGATQFVDASFKGASLGT